MSLTDAAAQAWPDLKVGPVILTMPDMNDLYYVVQAMGEWSISFATVGTRATGNRANTVIFTMEASIDDAKNLLSSRLQATIITTPGTSVWLLMRIQSNDSSRIKEIQQLATNTRWSI